MKNNFNVFVASSAFSLLGIEIYHITLPLLALSLNLDPVQISWCVFAFYCPVIFIKIISSPFIEKSNKINVLKCSECGRILCLALFILLLTLLRDASFLWIMAFSLAYGVFTVLTEVTEPVVIKELIQGHASTSALSTYEIRTRAVQLVAPALCGYLISVNFFFPYSVNLLFSLLAVFLLFLIRIDVPQTASPAHSTMGADIQQAFRWLRDNKLFSVIVALTALNNFLHPILYLTVIWSLKAQNTAFEIEITGLVLSGLGAGGLIGSFISRKVINILSLRQLVLFVNLALVLVFFGFLVFTDPVSIFVLFVFKAIMGGYGMSVVTYSPFRRCRSNWRQGFLR
ncbi:hypothetical protein CS369_10505 [Candidatus Symbiopectobacterium sp. 'North America']|uniref:MFS transporter n=1 Tax=Candidatus Symbiopectobacterium sp. 'North America' TaxID=2794574 RepID=UPI0018CA2A0B|nr:MFS transporter [Candidatus Symbiopectobacterium sp. 'North America']MBG6245093.1 hypothetical protein [Candidatus Symbiopectobacterium sp. 'North America']